MGAQAGLRVLHVNLAKGFRGGERQTVLLIQALARQSGVRQWLVCRSQSPMRQQLQGLDVCFIDARQPWQGHWQAPQADVVHAHEARAMHWAWLHRWLRRTPYLLTRRMDTPVRRTRFNRLVYGQAAAVVAISSPVEQDIAPLARVGRALRIPDAYGELLATPAGVQAVSASLGQGFWVGNVAALVDKHKGQRVLLQAARLLRDEAPSMRFLFLGAGADAEALAQESAGMGNVRWEGFQENVGDYLANLDVFAFPSRFEGLGSSVLDAMSFDVPVVASEVGGIPDIVADGRTGLLVPPGDARALADALLRLFNDAALRQELARAARAALDDFSPQAMAQRYLDAYRQVLQPTQ